MRWVSSDERPGVHAPLAAEAPPPEKEKNTVEKEER